MRTTASRLLWNSPLPPLPSGISRYSMDLIGAVGAIWPMYLLPEPGSNPSVTTVPVINARQAKQRFLNVVHLGNSQYHRHGFRLALDQPGIVVLHDVVLHHARLAELVRRGKGRQYRELMSARYGSPGEAVARDVLRGAPVDLSDFPLSEDYIEFARLAVVHNGHALQKIRQIAPGQEAMVVPMGVPLPALVDRDAARIHLGLPSNAFIITSITHVNPMKRLHVVMQALRRVVQSVPEALLVVAGSVAPGIDLERQASLLGIERHVRVVGYLSDDDSRVLARAGDVAVNLRYPSAGETSASLLRLLGSARPVIITAHGPALEVPEYAALRIPVDRLEEETLAEMLVWLAGDDAAREEIGAGGRRYVEEHHSMRASVEGYRAAIQRAFGVDLPELDQAMIEEPAPALTQPRASRSRVETTSQIEGSVADSLAYLGLSRHDGTIQRVANSMVELGLDRQERGVSVTSDGDRSIAPELLEILACPVCKSQVRLDEDELVCENCGRRYRIENGIPIMLVEDPEK